MALGSPGSLGVTPEFWSAVAPTETRTFGDALDRELRRGPVGAAGATWEPQHPARPRRGSRGGLLQKSGMLRPRPKPNLWGRHWELRRGPVDRAEPRPVTPEFRSAVAPTETELLGTPGLGCLGASGAGR